MGNEIRKDYLLERWAVIAAKRGKRPEDFVKKPEPDASGSGVCFFCPGNEHKTPPEICRVEEGGRWLIRCFPNMFPATGFTRAKKRKGLLTSIPAYGRHEVIVETPDHEGLLHKLSLSHLMRLLDVYQRRTEALQALRGVRYALVFKNFGRPAGASLYHTHTQVIGLPNVPPLILEEAEKSGGGRRCVLCRVLKEELASERRVYEDGHVGAYAPYASRFPFEVWVQPKRHVRSLGELTGEEKESFVNAIRYILGRLYGGLGGAPYNFYFHASPPGKNLHIHLEICPKISKIAGFELGTGMFINVVPPEQAAEFYRRKNI